MFVNIQESAIGVIRNMGTTLCAILVSVLVVGVPAWAQEAETETKPLKLGSAKTSAKPKGLAGYAATVKLNKGEDKTISNSSLKTSSKGTLSVGGGVNTGVSSANKAVGPGGIGEASKSETWNKDYDDQKKKIADMEKNQAANEKRKAEQTDPYQMSAYNRPGGVSSPYDTEKEKAAKELEAERKALDKMRLDARRDGVNIRRK